MKFTKIRLGDHIKRISIKNKDGAIGLDKYVSVSENKILEPTRKPKVVAGTDPKQYKVVEEGQFVFCPIVHFRSGLTGGRLYEDVALVSSAYEVFEVESEVLDPEYLQILFSTVKFDKHVDYYAHGSARRFFRWKRLCAMEFDIPSLAEQKEIVSKFEKVKRLIDLKLEMLHTLYEIGDNLFRDEFCEVNHNSNLITRPSKSPIRLGEIVTFKQGPRPYLATDKFTLMSKRSENEPYPAFSNNSALDDIYGYVCCYDAYKETSLTVDRVGATTKLRYQRSYAVNGVFNLIYDETKCTPEYLFYYLRNTHIITSGTIDQRRESSQKSLGKHKVYLVSLEEQKQFADRVRPLLKLAEQCIYDIYELRQVRKSWLTDFQPEVLAKPVK